MDLSDRCCLLLERIADRVPPDVLAEARSYGADGEWEAALITVINTGIYFGRELEDLCNELLDELADPRRDEAPVERRRELLAHPSHSQYYLHDWDCEYDFEGAPLEEDELISVHAGRHLVKVATGMWGFDLPLAVEILDAEPSPDLAAWQEVSEATAVLTGPVLLIAYSPEQADQFPLPAGPDQTSSYRVRVHATGRAEAAEAVHVSADDGEPLPESHLIQVWPAPVEPLKTWKP
ncbi:MAG: hypothetical protein ABSA02_32770 [Trebonia sp.]|jgi:hypothetical protein